MYNKLIFKIIVIDCYPEENKYNIRGLFKPISILGKNLIDMKVEVSRDIKYSSYRSTMFSTPNSIYTNYDVILKFKGDFPTRLSKILDNSKVNINFWLKIKNREVLNEDLYGLYIKSIVFEDNEEYTITLGN